MWGIIYIVRNEKLGKQIVKVGKTSRSIEERIRELNAPTSNLGTFEAIAYFPVSNIDQAEADCHAALAEYRVQQNREFFDGDIQKIVSTVKSIADAYKPLPFASVAVDSPQQSVSSMKGLSERIEELEVRKKRELYHIELKYSRLRENFLQITAEMRDSAHKLAAEFAHHRDILLNIPSSRATLFEAKSFRELLTMEELQQVDCGTVSALAILRSREVAIPIVEARLSSIQSPDKSEIFSSATDSKRLNCVPLLEIGIYARISPARNTHFNDIDNLYAPDEPLLCLHIAVFQFREKRSHTHELQRDGICTSLSQLDQAEVLDCFLQIIAENIGAIRELNNNIKRSSDSGKFSPNLRSIFSIEEEDWSFGCRYYRCQVCFHTWNSFKSDVACPACNGPNICFV